MTSKDKIEQVGELLYDLACQRKESEVVVVRSDDQRLSGLSISEVENILNIITEKIKAKRGYKKTEEIDGSGNPIVKFSIMVDESELRDYLIEAHGKSDNTPVRYWLGFDENEWVILNNKYVLAKPRALSNSYYIIEYLMSNPNMYCLKTDIEKKHKTKITRSMAKTMGELGFEGELKKLFCKSLKDRVLLRNPITAGLMEKLKIDKQGLAEEISSLRPYQ